jgi:hypothetical protein
MIVQAPNYMVSRHGHRLADPFPQAISCINTDIKLASSIEQIPAEFNPLPNLLQGLLKVLTSHYFFR